MNAMLLAALLTVPLDSFNVVMTTLLHSEVTSWKAFPVVKVLSASAFTPTGIFGSLTAESVHKWPAAHNVNNAMHSTKVQLPLLLLDLLSKLR